MGSPEAGGRNAEAATLVRGDERTARGTSWAAHRDSPLGVARANAHIRFRLDRTVLRPMALVRPHARWFKASFNAPAAGGATRTSFKRDDGNTAGSRTWTRKNSSTQMPMGVPPRQIPIKYCESTRWRGGSTSASRSKHASAGGRRERARDGRRWEAEAHRWSEAIVPDCPRQLERIQVQAVRVQEYLTVLRHGQTVIWTLQPLVAWFVRV